MSIRVESISKRFGDAVALDDVSLDVPSGSLTALLGPSGGGKSTLLRIIAGLDTPDAGTVTIEGEDLTDAPARQRGVGFCFQHYAPFRHLTVRRNVAFGLEVRRRPKPEIKARVDELLELVGLAHLAERYPSQLSGGQRQRMALARALAYGVLLTTARVLGEFGAVAVVSGNIVDKTQTLTLYVDSAFTNFDTTGAYAGALVLALISMSVLAALSLSRKRERTQQ